MIGRGALRNPWIFRQCTGELGDTLDPTRMALLRRFHELLQEHYDTRRILLYLRKLAVWLAFGYPGASAFRGAMFQTPTTGEVMERAEEYFANVDDLPIPRFDESEAFMMGGHG